MAKQQKVVIDIPTWLGPEEREAVATEIVQTIRERTSKGLDKDGKPFPKYSESYMDSMDFKAGGKTGKVDLQLSGDMIAVLDTLDHRRGKIEIGYDAGDPINDRVEGNRLGSYGGTPNPAKARDFLGITKKELSRILDKYEPGGSRATKVNDIAEAARMYFPDVKGKPDE